MAKTNFQPLATWKQTEFLTLLNKALEPHVTGYICNWDPHCRGILLGAGFLVSPRASGDVDGEKRSDWFAKLCQLRIIRRVTL